MRIRLTTLWSLTIVDPRKVRLTNESYGFEKDEHRYVVTVEESDGVIVPVECECPADQYNEDYDCKHKVALATIGSPVVLGAAMDYKSDESKPPVREDGGVIEVDQGTEQDTDEECSCEELTDDFPCWPCYRDGRRDPTIVEYNLDLVPFLIDSPSFPLGDSAGSRDRPLMLCISSLARGLSTEDVGSLRGQAKNALLRHVKTLDSEHGEPEELPTGCSEGELLDYIAITEDVETSLDEDPRSA